jgi:hypothetical protein
VLLSATTYVANALQTIVRLELGIKASIQDISACDGPLAALQKVNGNARINIQEIKKVLEELELFAKGEYET